MELNKLCPRIALAVASCAVWIGVAAAQQSTETTAPAYTELSAVAVSGAIQLFAIRADSEIERRYAPQPGGAFSGVEALGGQGVDIAAVQLADANLDAFLVGMDSALWENRQQADGSWSGWVRLGGDATRVAAVHTPSSLALLSLRKDGQLELRQRAADSEEWSEPVALGFRAKRLAAVADATGTTLSLFVVGLDDAVWRGAVDLAAPSSNAWQDLGGLVHDIAAARSASGTLEVVLVGDDGAMWRNVEEQGVYAGWGRVGGEVARVDLAQGASTLSMFGLTREGGVRVATLDAQREWSELGPLDITEASAPEPAAPLASTFRGQVQVEIPSLDVTVSRDLSFDVRFSADRRQVEITAFAPIVTESFDTPFGSNFSTVTWAGGGTGTFDASTGRIDLPVSLHFDQSLSIPFVNTDVDASFVLSTAADGGAALDLETGQLVLAASSKFTGSGANPLRDAAVRVVLSGGLDPRP